MDRNKVLNARDPPNSWTDQVINAAIMGLLGFFTALVGIGATGLLADWKLGLSAAGISAGFEFALSLAVQRGLYKAPESNPRGE